MIFKVNVRLCMYWRQVVPTYCCLQHCYSGMIEYSPKTPLTTNLHSGSTQSRQMRVLLFLWTQYAGACFAYHLHRELLCKSKSSDPFIQIIGLSILKLSQVTCMYSPVVVVYAEKNTTFAPLFAILFTETNLQNGLYHLEISQMEHRQSKGDVAEVARTSL